MTNKNLNAIIFAVNYTDIEKFHMFMRDFKTHDETFEKYADFLAERLSLEQDILNSFDYLVCVPSLASDRPNYSLKLAEFISRKINKPLRPDAVSKIKHTKELKTLPREERHKEIEDSFTADINPGDKICIIDDVTASGATLDEISKVLKDAGAGFVCAAVVAVYMHPSLHNL